MASQGFVPGPAQVFISQTTTITYSPPAITGGTWTFVGYSENGVETRFRSVFEDVYSDPMGPAIPLDQQWMGEDAWTSMILNKYDEAVLGTLMKRRVGSSVVQGAIEANGLGGLMIAQGYIFSLLVLAPYNVLAFQSASIKPCYLFAASYLADEASVPTSIRLKRPQVTFRSVPVMNTTTLQAVLYTNTVPSPTPTPD